MAEFDTIYVTNPLNEDFAVRFNGENYELGKKERKSFPEFLGFHVAKHLSDKMLGTEIEKLKKAEKENPFNPRVGQLLVYDNPKRRITLFQILGSKKLVEECISAYPFKGFIGEMSEYDEFADGKAEAPTAEVNVVETETEEKPKAKRKPATKKYTPKYTK